MKHTKKIMEDITKGIRAIDEYYANWDTNHKTQQLPSDPGVYAFWWIGKKNRLLEGETLRILSGPGGKCVCVTLEDWWPSNLTYPCLYVGKTTNIRKRFSQHIKRTTEEKILEIDDQGKPRKHKNNTACQLRHGIEYTFRNEASPLDIIRSEVGFSYKVIGEDNSTAERFYAEDLCIGTWMPWFNVDSER